MASRLPRRAAEFDTGKKSSGVLSALGSAVKGMFSGGGGGRAAAGAAGGFLTGGAGGMIAGGLGGLLGPTGGRSSSTSGALGAFGRGALGSFGGGSGGNLPVITQGTQGAPAAQQRFTPTAPGQGRYDNPAMRPSTGSPGFGDKDSFSGRGIGGSFSSGETMGGAAWREKNRLAQANEANVAAYNKAFASANAANESRYQELLGIANATTGQRAKDITADFGSQQASAMQNLASLGLANTSGASTIRGGFGRKKNAALDRLADQMQQTKLGIIERRTDKIPDLASLVSLGQLGISGLKF